MQPYIPRPLTLSLGMVALLALAPSVGTVAAGARGPQPALVTATIKGTLESRYTRKYSALVYLTTEGTQRFDVPVVNPVMDQVNLMFSPHVLGAQVGASIDFPNSDQVRHNVYTTKSSVCQFNLGTYPAGTVRTITCAKAGVVTVLCNVHAEMSGYIVFAPTPYFASTDSNGEFSITDVPAGTYQLTFWHERLQSQSVEVVVSSDTELFVEFTGLERK